MESICLHCFVSGHVQGVFYRRWVYDFALAQGLVGWVKNLEDGRVEVLISGEKKAAETLKEALWKGPAAAKVSGVVVEEIPLEQQEQQETFEIRF